MSRDEEEFEMEFDDDTNYLMERLVKEGRFRDKSDFVSYAIQNKEFGPAEDLETDPALDQRIMELRLIQQVEDNLLEEFFADTSYIMQSYSRLANDADYKEAIGEMELYMADLNRMLGNPGISENDANHFLDRTVELADDFWHLSNEEDAGYEAIVDEYLREYFEDVEMKEKLMSQ